MRLTRWWLYFLQPPSFRNILMLAVPMAFDLVSWHWLTRWHHEQDQHTAEASCIWLICTLLSRQPAVRR